MTEQTKKKTRACRDTDYLFVSAYLRAKEPQLLSREKAERMLASSVQEAARILEGCGYADVLSVGLDRALNDRRTAVFDDLEAIAPKDGIVSLFRMRYDYHNAKTIVKAEAMGKDPSGLLLGGGRVDAQALKTAYETGEAGPAPQAVLEAMTAARDALSRSADPQLADLILDRAYFAEYHAAAAQVGSSFLMGYAALQADSANLRAAVRARRMHKDAAFLKSVLVPGGSVPAEEICQVLAQDEPFAPLFANTALFAAAQAGAEIRFVTNDLTLSDGMRMFAPTGSAEESNTGLCVLAAGEKYDILVTGDLSEQAEYRLLSTHALPRAAVLVAGHHGAASSTSEALLRAIRPEAVLISVGADNRFGHPADETLRRIEKAGAAVFRTDLSGTITIRG